LVNPVIKEMFANKKVNTAEVKKVEISERRVGPIFDSIFKDIMFKIVL